MRARELGRAAAGAATRGWPPRSRLFLVGDAAAWSIDHDMAELGAIARRLGARPAATRLLRLSRGQAAFFGSQFELLRRDWSPPRHALATAYFHGVPGTPGMPEFDECHAALVRHHREIERIQVSHSEMEAVVLSTGIDPAKVFRIPIGVDPELFAPASPESRTAARRSLGLPDGAFVVGSFLKDGVGMGAGDEPKWIKGPDVLVEALRALRDRVPELHVLLSGPARGFVRRRLDELGIPYRHRLVGSLAELPALYRSVDATMIASRQEGGPKTLLESMASGVPVVTTRVGQAMDLVRHRENAWMVDVEDAEALAASAAEVAAGGAAVSAVVAAGRQTAEANAYARQDPVWRRLLEGFVTLR